MRNHFFPVVFAVVCGFLASSTQAATKKRAPDPKPAAAGDAQAPTTTPSPTEPEPESSKSEPDRHVSLFGTSLRLGTVLDQLARNLSLRLVVHSDVDLRAEIQVPTLQNVELRDALRVILTPIGYSFAIEGNELVVFARYVRVFRVSVPTIQQQWLSSVSNESTSGEMGNNSSGGGGGGGGAQSAPSGASGGQNLGAQITLKSWSSGAGLWDDIDTTLKTLSSKDGTYSINRTAGLVTFNDRPYALDAVERYIEAVNREMGRQAVVEVRIAEVTLTDRTRTGLDWNLLWDRLGGVTVASNSSSGTDLFSTAGKPITVAAAGVAGRAVLNALEEQGEVHLVSQPNLLVGNNLPAIIQAGRVLSFVKAVRQTAVPNVGIQTSLDTDVVSDGLIMSLLPRISEDNTVTLAVSVVLQELVSLQGRQFGDQLAQIVELPSFNRRSYSGVVGGHFGQTLIIAGLIGKKESENTSGVPLLSKIPLLGIFFGGHDDSEQNSELVILLSPKSATAAPTKVEPMPLTLLNED